MDSVKRKRGQATLEYFIIFSVIVAGTLISAEVLWPAIRDRMQGTGKDGKGGFYYEAGERLVGADGGGAGDFSALEAPDPIIIDERDGGDDVKDRP